MKWTKAIAIVVPLNNNKTTTKTTPRNRTKQRIERRSTAVQGATDESRSIVKDLTRNEKQQQQLQQQSVKFTAKPQISHIFFCCVFVVPILMIMFMRCVCARKQQSKYANEGKGAHNLHVEIGLFALTTKDDKRMQRETLD